MSRLGICIAGLNGAVASTMVTGMELIKRGLAEPRALVSESYRATNNLADIDSLAFGGWDIRRENLHRATLRNAVIEPTRVQPIAKALAAIQPWPAKPTVNQIQQFRRRQKLDSVVVLNLLPTGENRASAAYALTAARAGCPFVNFTPNDCNEQALDKIPYAGRDGKTGQTWLKSVLAPALHARDLRITGWYSTNLLGNEDGRIVGDPEKGRQKIRDKSKLLGEMLGYEPHHQVQINYYPPRGDNKESWDNIDFEGFLGMPMQLKVNALYRDSILAAPMCLDLVRFIELAQRRGDRGAQEWLSFYFKSPYAANAGSPPPHAAAKQEQMLMDYLRRQK